MLSARIVLARGRPASSCRADDATGCVVATRKVRYLPGERLTLPVGLFQSCFGVVCPEESTCNSLGQCVSDEMSPGDCAAETGCILPGDPPSVPGVKRPAASDAGALLPDAGPQPPLLPAPLTPTGTYLDSDIRRGFVSGTLRVMAAQESEPIDRYELWFANAEGKRQFLGEGQATAGALQRAFLPGSEVPPGFDFLEVTALRRGQASAPLRVRIDNYPRARDVGGQAGIDALLFPKLFVDEAAQRLIVTGTDVFQSPTARVCNLDGSNCTARAIDAGLGPSSASKISFFNSGTPEPTEVSAAFDAVGRRLFATTTSLVPNRLGGRLIVCNVDTWLCFERPAPQVGPSTIIVPPTPTVPELRLVETAGSGLFGQGSATVLSCDPNNATPCTSHPLPAGAKGGTYLGAPMVSVSPNSSGFRVLLLRASEPLVVDCPTIDSCAARTFPAGTPAISLSGWKDPYTGRIGAIGRGAQGTSVVHWDCDESLASCTSRTLSAPAGSWQFPLALGAPTAGFFQAVVHYAPPGQQSRPVWLDCAQGPGTCTIKDAPSSVSLASFAAKTATRSLIAARRDSVVSVLSCDGTLTSCPIADLAGGTSSGSAEQTDAALDPNSGRAITVSSSPSLGDRLTLFVCQPDDGPCVHRDPTDAVTANGSEDPRALIMPSGIIALAARDKAPAYSNELTAAQLVVCDSTGTACSGRLLSDASGTKYGAVQALFDASNNKLLVVAFTDSAAHLFRCSADGNGCSHRSLGSLKLGAASSTSAVVLDKLGKLFLSTTRDSMTCALDGTGCVNIGAADSGEGFPFAADQVRDQLLLPEFAGGKPKMRQCDLLGASCTSKPIVGDLKDEFGRWHASVMDAKLGVLYLGRAASGFIEYFRCQQSTDRWHCASVYRSAADFVNVLTPPPSRFSMRVDEVRREFIGSFASPVARRPVVVRFDLH